MRRQIWIQAVTLATSLNGVCAQLDSLQPCGATCINNVIAKGFGCISGDNACLCKQQAFVFGIRDCAAQSCPPDATPKVNDYVTSLCEAADKAPPAAQNTPGIPSSTSLPPPPSISITALTAASAAQNPALSVSAASEEPSGFMTDATHAANLPITTLATLSTPNRLQPSMDTGSSKSTAAGAPPSQSPSSTGSGAEPSNNEAEGISMPARIGIGVGAGAGVLATVLAWWLLVRRSRSQARSMQISDPMPGSGRDYTGDNIGVEGKNYSELEMRSRRYEDMLPRESPIRLI